VNTPEFSRFSLSGFMTVQRVVQALHRFFAAIGPEIWPPDFIQTHAS
jgi:hypothetical protein